MNLSTLCFFNALSLPAVGDWSITPERYIVKYADFVLDSFGDVRTLHDTYVTVHWDEASTNVPLTV